MPRLFAFPFLYGNGADAPVSAESAVAVSAPARWGSLGGTAKSWNAAVVALLPRFERVVWGSGRLGWTGGTLGGALNYEVSPEYPFVVSPNGSVVIGSETTVNS